MTIRHDQEHALGDLTRLVRERRGHSTYLERAPVASQQSVGAIERAASLETVSRGATPASQIIPASRGLQGTLGGLSRAISSSHQDELHSRHSRTRDTRAKLCVGWSEKIWLRKSEISDKHVCGCSDGRTRHSTVQETTTSTLGLISWMSFGEPRSKLKPGSPRSAPGLPRSRPPSWTCESGRGTQSTSKGGASCASTAVCGHSRRRYRYEGHRRRTTARADSKTPCDRGSGTKVQAHAGL